MDGTVVIHEKLVLAKRFNSGRLQQINIVCTRSFFGVFNITRDRLPLMQPQNIIENRDVVFSIVFSGLYRVPVVLQIMTRPSLFNENLHSSLKRTRFHSSTVLLRLCFAQSSRLTRVSALIRSFFAAARPTRSILSKFRRIVFVDTVFMLKLFNRTRSFSADALLFFLTILRSQF